MMNNKVYKNYERMLKGTNFKKKTELRVQNIVDYLKNSNLKAVVLGVSGGIDSAFVLELLLCAKKQYNFDIHTVFFKHGLHEYEANHKKVIEYLKNKDVIHKDINLAKIIEATQNEKETNNKVNTQYAYALMYTLLFRVAQEYGGVTFGTTNKDEFGIGWFGKTSDMVVDIQPIHDFHKFEIYNSPLITQIPENIVEAAPNGDLITGKSDEEVFGCSYNEVASILNMIEQKMDLAHIWEDYKMLKDVIDENSHKLVKPKNEFNPFFL